MIGEIEDAIVKRIQDAAAAAPGFGYKLATVASYGGHLDDPDLAQVIRAFPAVWVTYAGGPKPVKANASGSKWKTGATFAVMCGSRNIRGERATRQGVTAAGVIKEVGVYQMLEDVSRILKHQDLGLPIYRLVPGATRTLYNTRLGSNGMAVFAREFHTMYIEADPVDTTGADFLKLGMNFFSQLNHSVTPDDLSEITLL